MDVPMIGMDLGVTAKTEIAVAEGSKVTRTFRAPSTPAGLTAAVRKAAAAAEGEVGLVLESTAMAGFVAGVAAERSGVQHKLYRVSGRKAAALRAFYRSHTKTDRIDARVLARIPLVDEGLREFTLPTKEQHALKRLVTMRQKLVKQATSLKGRVRSTLHWAAPGLLGKSSVNEGIVAILERWPSLERLAAARTATIRAVAGVSGERARHIRKHAKAAVEFYQDRVEFEMLALELELTVDQLKQLHAQQEKLDEHIRELHEQLYPEDVLFTLPGVGPTIAPVVRALVGNLSNFGNLASFRAYTGLVPRENSSGDARRRGKISKAGPNLLRWALYLAADVARRHDPDLAALYRRLMLERGHHHQQAICAVASHLVGRIWAVIREDRPYQHRDLDGNPITREEAQALAQELAIDKETRERLKTGQQKREPNVSRSRQPKTPQDHAQLSPSQLTETALELAQHT